MIAVPFPNYFSSYGSENFKKKSNFKFLPLLILWKIFKKISFGATHKECHLQNSNL